MIDLLAFAGFGLVSSVMGILLGIWSERNAWVIRAFGPGKCNTPHYCNGEFYYIVPESIFVNEFMRRPAPGDGGARGAGQIVLRWPSEPDTAKGD